MEFEGRAAVSYIQEMGDTRSRFYYFQGEEGIYMLGMAMSGQYVEGTMMTYAPPMLAFPNNLTIGHKWSEKSTMTTRVKNASPMNIEMSTDYEVAERETVSVPAGEFDCYRIESRSNAAGVETRNTSWYSPEVGYYVKFETSSKHFTMKSPLLEHHISASPLLLGASAAPKPKAPASLAVSVSFSEPSGNNILDARETGKLIVTVANSGPGPAYGVRLAAVPEKSLSGLALPGPIALGKIDPGKSETRDVPLEASKEIGSEKVSIRLEVKEANGFDADAKVVQFETKAYRAPKLEISGLRLGGLGVVKAGEPTSLSFTVRNSGEGPAQNAAATLELASRDIFASGDTTLALGSIEPGAGRKVEFEFFVNKRYKGEKLLPVFVSLTEAEGRFGVKSRSLGLELGGAAPSVEVVAIQGRSEAPPRPADPDAEDIDAPPTASTPRDPEAYAVVIGIEKYRDVPPVDFAARDAQAMHGYLTRSMGFDPKNVVLLQNERATGKDFDKYLGTWLKNRVTVKSRVFVFYAGHGAPNPKTGEGYLIPFEGDPNYTEDTAYPIKRLYDSLARLPSQDVTVALDACFSGAGGRSVLAKGARPLVNVAKTVSTGGNTMVLSAASSDQISASYQEGRHGLLTYFLLKGLRGGADSDKDGRVTTSELFGYVRPAVEREARLQNIEQTPTLSPAPEVLGARGGRVWIMTR